MVSFDALFHTFDFIDFRNVDVWPTHKQQQQQQPYKTHIHRN